MCLVMRFLFLQTLSCLLKDIDVVIVRPDGSADDLIENITGCKGILSWACLQD